MQGVLDGGGGNDCIVTFRDGPAYVSIGGPGNDTIIANVPPGTTDEQIDALCAQKPASDVPKVTANIQAGGLKLSLKKEGRATDWAAIGAVLLGIVLLLAIARILARPRSERLPE